jgi:hypothetical protein
LIPNTGHLSRLARSHLKDAEVRMMADEQKKKREELGRQLRERGPFPARKGRTAPFEEIGEWQELPNGIWRREIVISGECVRVEMATSSKDQAEHLANALNALPDELDEARKTMNALAERIECQLSAGQQVVSADILALVSAARDVERLFQREASSAEAARRFENWEKKSGFGRDRTKKDSVAAAKAEAKLGAKNLWEERRSGKHPKLRTVEQFATEVMKRWPVLESAKVICQWSADWTKEAKAKRHPAS